MNNADIGETLKRLRVSAGFSAKEVSRCLKEQYGIDMSYITLYNYEKARSMPDIKRFLALCEIYKVDDIYKEFGFDSVDGEESPQKMFGLDKKEYDEFTFRILRYAFELAKLMKEKEK